MSIYQTFKKMQTGPVMIGIALFAIATFTITGAVTQTFARDPKKEAQFWATMPSGKKVGFSENDRTIATVSYNLLFDSTNQSHLLYRLMNSRDTRYQRLFSQLLMTQSWATRHLGRQGDMKNAKGNNPTEQMMLVNAIARDRGIEVATAEVQEWLQSAFSGATSAEAYKSLCAGLQMTYGQFQESLRETMLYGRALDMFLAQTPVPTGDELIQDWVERNERYTFDVAAFSAEDRKKTIDKASVTDEQLKKWFDAKAEFERNKYREPEKYVLEGLAVLDAVTETQPAPNATFQALVDAAQVQDTDGQSYVAIAKVERFKKPAPPTPNPGTDPKPATVPASEFFTFEEVKEKALKEVKIARALEKVKGELEAESMKPGFELKSFAQKWGLQYWNSGEPRVVSDLRNIPVHGCIGLIMTVSDVKEGDFFSGYQPAPGAIQITRLVKKTASRIPEPKEIREKLVPDYIDETSFEKAKDDANAFRDAILGANVKENESAFDKIAKEKNVAIQRLAPIPKGLLEFEANDPAKFSKDLTQFLASRGDAVWNLKKDAVSATIANPEMKAVYVIRCADRQMPTIKDIPASDYLAYKNGVDGGDGRHSRLLLLREKKCLEMISSENLEKSLKVERPNRATQSQ